MLPSYYFYLCNGRNSWNYIGKELVNIGETPFRAKPSRSERLGTPGQNARSASQSFDFVLRTLSSLVSYCKFFHMKNSTLVNIGPTSLRRRVFISPSCRATAPRQPTSTRFEVVANAGIHEYAATSHRKHRLTSLCSQVVTIVGSTSAQRKVVADVAHHKYADVNRSRRGTSRVRAHKL